MVRLATLPGGIVTESLKGKKPFSWRKYALLAVVLVLVGRTVWNIPRRGWSLKDAGRAGTVPKTALYPKEIRHVVLISIDTCRADHLGCYGYSRKTSPNIDAVASEGILFNHAVTSVPITLPSHSSMLTGTTPLYHKVRDNSSYRLGNSNVTLAEILQENGLVTGAVIGAFVLDSQFGLDQGFDTYNDNLEKEDKKPFLFNERKAEEVTRFANIFLEKHRNDKFFLFLHYFDPHCLYEAHKNFPFTSVPLVAFSRDCYDSEIAYTDRCIGQVIKKLKGLNLYDSTLLIITADHGESLGEHSESSHGYFIYHSTLHVPLIIKVPGGPRGKIVNDVAGLIDIVPTVCGLLGFPIPQQVEGKDLSAFFSNGGGCVEQRYLYCESLMPTKLGVGPLLGLISNRWKYIHTLKPELYDLREDHRETENLLNKQRQQAHIMQNQLELALQNDRLNNVADSKVVLDEETRKRLQSLGYISSRTVNENIQLDQVGLDPKKFIEVYNFIDKFFELALKKKFDKAKKLCDRMLKKWPDMKQTHYLLGLIAVSEGDIQAISTHFSQYLEHMKSDSNDFDMRVRPKYELATAHGNLGIALQHEGQIERAIAHFKKAMSYNPYMVETKQKLAGAYLIQGEYDQAIKHFNEALRIDPNCAQAQQGLKRAILLKSKTRRR